jgi:hypothetical protein
MNGQNVTFSDMLLPALVGGGIAGLLSGIPLVGCLCCLWLLLGGAIAVYMLRGKSLSMKEALIVGIFAGFFAALAGSLVDGLASLVSGQSTADSMAQAIATLRQMGYPQQNIQQAEQLMRLLGRRVGPLALVCGFFMRLIFGSIFTVIGALGAKSLMKPKVEG